MIWAGERTHEPTGLRLVLYLLREATRAIWLFSAPGTLACGDAILLREAAGHATVRRAVTGGIPVSACRLRCACISRPSIPARGGFRPGATPSDRLLVSCCRHP